MLLVTPEIIIVVVLYLLLGWEARVHGVLLGGEAGGPGHVELLAPRAVIPLDVIIAHGAPPPQTQALGKGLISPTSESNYCLHLSLVAPGAGEIWHAVHSPLLSKQFVKAALIAAVTGVTVVAELCITVPPPKDLLITLRDVGEMFRVYVTWVWRT